MARDQFSLGCSYIYSMDQLFILALLSIHPNSFVAFLPSL